MDSGGSRHSEARRQRCRRAHDAAAGASRTRGVAQAVGLRKGVVGAVEERHGVRQHQPARSGKTSKRGGDGHGCGWVSGRRQQARDPPLPATALPGSPAHRLPPGGSGMPYASLLRGCCGGPDSCGPGAAAVPLPRAAAVCHACSCREPLRLLPLPLLALHPSLLPLRLAQLLAAHAAAVGPGPTWREASGGRRAAAVVTAAAAAGWATPAWMQLARERHPSWPGIALGDCRRLGRTDWSCKGRAQRAARRRAIMRVVRGCSRCTGGCAALAASRGARPECARAPGLSARASLMRGRPAAIDWTR